VTEDRCQDIVELRLAWKVDVLHGVRDGVAVDATHLLLTCRAWNHPACRELERLLPLLAEANPNLYRNVAERYWRACTRRVLRCPRCLRFETFTASNSNGHIRVHKHNGKSVTLRPAIVPMLDERVEPERIERGIAWLADNWQGVEPMLPRDLVAGRA
jgi:hypothetical protein